MEYLKVVEGRASPKREFKSSKARNQRAMKSNILDAIAHINGGRVVSQKDENGVVRVKIVVKRGDLKQMLEVIKGVKKNSGQPPNVPTNSSSCLDQRLNFMRKRQHLRANQERESCRSSWRPALQSIPEEF